LTTFALITPDQAAERLGITRRYLMDNYRGWGCPSTKFGKRTVRFRPEDIDALQRRIQRRSR
jgi:excisionase family DNA binding protein